MELLPHGSDNDNRVVPYDETFAVDQYRPSYPGPEQASSKINAGAYLKQYWLLVVAMLVIGAAAGFASVVFSTPSYRARLLLEWQSPTAFTKNGVVPIGSSSDSEVEIETQISILHSGTFLSRVAERMNQETVPLATPERSIFSKLRERVRPTTQDPIENAKRGMNTAMATFIAKAVNKTRLIELTCESSSPDSAAQFLNAMAAEYTEYATRSRMESAQKTSEFLAQQIDETEHKMQAADEHLRDFIISSGNIFAGQDSTLEDTKLTSLKADLAKVQADAIAKLTRYELTKRYPPEALGEVLDDGVLRGYQQKINQLTQEKAALEVKFTPKHEKVRELDAQLASVQRDYQNEIHSVVARIKNDYEAASQQEKLLNQSYNTQAARVGGQAAKASQYNSLKRQAETFHQVYQSLLISQSDVGMNASVPGNPIQIVEQAIPPAFPYTPRPALNISFGCLIGVMLAVGIAFLRERMDHSIRNPGMARQLFNVPELGVIPNLEANGLGVKALREGATGPLTLNGKADEAAAALVNWRGGPSFVTESFRGTLTSILRNQLTGKRQKTILITSPGPGEGKTTVTQHLGIALAETGRRVLLVDADFRRPNLHHKFGLPDESGIIDLISDDTPVSQYSGESLGIETSFPGLFVLPNGAGSRLANVSRALYLPRFREIFQMLAKHYDMVLVDTPPIHHVADARIIAPLTDAVILVLRSGVTDRSSAMEAYQRIQEDGLNLLGTVLTDHDFTGERKRQYYYDYGDPQRA